MAENKNPMLEEFARIDRQVIKYGAGVMCVILASMLRILGIFSFKDMILASSFGIIWIIFWLYRDNEEVV